MNWKNKYDYVGNFYEGRAKVKLNNKEGFVDKEGKVVIPIIYDGVYDFIEGRATVELNDEFSHVDLDGKIIDGQHNLIRGCFKE